MDFSSILAFGLKESNFRPIYTRSHNAVLGYQLVSDNILSDSTQVNGKYKLSECQECHHVYYEVCDNIHSTEAYNGLGYPIFLTDEACKKLKHINSLYEDNDDIIISCELYDFLIKKYPHLECRPVFAGTVYEDREYLRLSNNK